jgi:hypothetical protein
MKINGNANPIAVPIGLAKLVIVVARGRYSMLLFSFERMVPGLLQTILLKHLGLRLKALAELMLGLQLQSR